MIPASILATLALAVSSYAAPVSSSSSSSMSIPSSSSSFSANSGSGSGPDSSSTSSSAQSSTSASSELEELCTVDHVQNILPANDTILGIEFLSDSVTAEVTSSSGGASGSSSSSYSYCNVTLTYTHTGKGDTVNVIYAFPDPSDFEKRFYLAGGGGFSLSSSATGGLEYGAASGATDAGYDAFDYSYDEVVLYGNGSINWDATYMFGFQALGELTKIGKPLTRGFYNLDDDEKIYTYFEGCSDGGREGMSQVQRFGEEYDGVVAGAPAFRFAHQQVLHVFPATIEHTMDYYPPPCALEKIVNLTIEACDELDGRKDGVISRTDLCQLEFNLSSLIGESYYCAEESSSSLGFGFSKRDQTSGSSSSTTPEQNGTITAEDISVAQAVYDGLHNTAGERAYISWQIGSDLSDANPTYDNDTEEWSLSIPSTGGEYVAKFIQLLDMDNLENLDNVTYDTLVEWINIGYFRYLDSLQTTLPDLTPFQESGGKLIHYHGESDPSVPAASSVHYWQSVRSIMYGHQPDESAYREMDDWYQFYLVPGAAHCGSNSLQPGPYPENNMDIIIDWVENGVKPSGLNATVSSGDYEGEEQSLCKFPLRPYWRDNTTTFDCVYDQPSIDSWTYQFPAFKVPIY